MTYHMAYHRLQSNLCIVMLQLYRYCRVGYTSETGGYKPKEGARQKFKSDHAGAGEPVGHRLALCLGEGTITQAHRHHATTDTFRAPRGYVVSSAFSLI